ncbi:hypothetical protein LTR36_009035 [Oleoguttula mirabilis]|uniref:Thioester reductase (TE) domain-containing protein n=1 Tax=Oleoguttula mirabilis TaxID=1507867 RepID=A0AAV9J711_9PEZI|nr:hypothetical protein LTR36_009035 [Oleoguttula mirabilis]
MLLKAVRLRSVLMKRFGKFPLMFIFEYSNVSALIRSLSSLGGEHANDRATAQHHMWMEDAIAQHAAEIRTWSAPSLRPHSGGEVVYLTGATGSLGNAILEAFISDARIGLVYCAVHGGEERLKQSLRRRGYPATVGESTKLCVLPYNMSTPALGLSQDYEKLAAQVTIVLHNAWKMDFDTPSSTGTAFTALCT